MHIRRYEPADQAAVAELHRVALQDIGVDPGPGPWDDDVATADAVIATYLVPRGEFLVGLVDDEIVAMGALKPVDDETVELKRMRVLPAAQRRGHGTAVLARLEALAVELGYRTIVLDTTTMQTAAIAMYRGRGYVQTGHSELRGFEVLAYAKRVG